MKKETREIAAFGRHWKFGKREEKSGQMLGVREGNSTPIDMGGQVAVYVLYERGKVVYVGKTERNRLIERLKEHKKGKKWGRWDRFSWYGIRTVDEESGELEDVKKGTINSSLVDVVESVLIEVLEPYLNNQKGKCTGEMYIQVRERIVKA